ncbi:bifunctional folylpolyglutamate synthase/dihydrofolate synthase [Niabella drilacis]|uniref:Dihydrofolate synthase/folylpolyglutamate synthase n=1 Tax=Niabella drilacis (strain DSM 25811 / CCM 8410 / CCUG 62505 / LMG 26954 / E90) TaxID=1285928 RepID=A0A1G6X198_NIADE|nr:folylpolyglutamate synthase/dihydrofolate synthase family protein [Niabella drilacis]SDD71035.1 dihydrofolate synthase / folylpolyglutamate synthase [Niabella drilacis]
MTYQETLDFIYDRLPMFSRVGASAIKNGFDNIDALCRALGDPQAQTRFIHIAGTNGKGSVSHMLASVLQTQGYKTGLYTSPHLTDFRERVKVDGAMISEQEVVDFIEKVRPVIEQYEPSFFEITVALAFDHFAAQKVDFAVIETGLGGRLDSTNIIHPLLSVITNIGLDHVQLLGDTLPKIAVEKAGIIKEGTPVIIGETQEETAPVFIRKAREQQAPISFADQVFHVENWFYEDEALVAEVSKDTAVDHYRYQPELSGAYQVKNLLTVLESCRQLRQCGIALDEASISKGIAHTKRLSGLHGRWETIHRNPRIVLDVAHNEDGMRQVLSQLELTPYRKLHLVLGMVKDKDVDKVLSLLPSTAVYYFTNAKLPRALPAAELMLKATAWGLKGTVWPDVNEALVAAKAQAHTNDLVLVCGSIFLVGEVSR